MKDSVVLTGEKLPEQVPPQVPIFRAYGDSDDALRLTVLMAGAIEVGAEGGELKKTCLSPRSTWKERSSALRSLFQHAAGRATSPYAALVDIDALAPRGGDADDDRPINPRIQSRFFDLIREAVAAGGWFVVRTAPNERVTAELAEADIPTLEQPSDAALTGEGSERLALDALAPECRPLARWLVERRSFRWDDVLRIVTQMSDPSGDLIRIAYDHLRRETRRVARSLSIVRAPNHLNGSFGRLAWGELDDEWKIPRAAGEELRTVGFLAADDGRTPSDVRLPRRARELLSLHARSIEGDALVSFHERLAKLEPFDGSATESQIEAHYHAARSGDVSLAKSTALFYGSELNAVATRLSREKKQYAAAADLFRYVTSTFDPEDAYAWEYRAYNLARADSAQNESGKHAAEIREAYQKAHLFAPWSALYHGRYLGYRAERGENVGYEIEHALSRYLERSADRMDESASRFVEAVFDGLKRGRQLSVRDDIVDRWRTRLEEVTPRPLAKHLG